MPPIHLSKSSSSVHLQHNTLQWLDHDQTPVRLIPNNIDAAFKKHTRKPKPSELLLHYNYGAAAIRCWGLGTEALQNRANPPRPSLPIPDPGGAGAGLWSWSWSWGLAESEGQPMWDEEDVMSFFWGNSLAAKKRHLKRVAENTRRIEQRRGGVPQDSV